MSMSSPGRRASPQQMAGREVVAVGDVDAGGFRRTAVAGFGAAGVEGAAGGDVERARQLADEGGGAWSARSAWFERVHARCSAEQGSSVGVTRTVEDGVGGAGFDDAAEIHD